MVSAVDARTLPVAVDTLLSISLSPLPPLLPLLLSPSSSSFPSFESIPLLRVSKLSFILVIPLFTLHFPLPPPPSLPSPLPLLPLFLFFCELECFKSAANCTIAIDLFIARPLSRMESDLIVGLSSGEAISASEIGVTNITESSPTPLTMGNVNAETVPSVEVVKASGKKVEKEEPVTPPRW